MTLGQFLDALCETEISSLRKAVDEILVDFNLHIKQLKAVIKLAVEERMAQIENTTTLE